MEEYYKELLGGEGGSCGHVTMMTLRLKVRVESGNYDE